MCNYVDETAGFQICLHASPVLTRSVLCRFGGIEGLRGMCFPKVIVEDRWPFLMRTAIPPPLQYPVAEIGFDFVHALCKMFYGSSIGMQLAGLGSVMKLFLLPSPTPAQKAKLT